MKMAKCKAAFMILTLGGGVLLCIGLLVYQAKASHLRALTHSRNAKRQELRGLQAKLATRPVLERKYEDLQSQLAALEPAVATYAYIPTFLRQIEKLAETTQNKVSGVKPLPLIAQTPTPAAGEDEEAQGSGKTAATAAPKKPYDSVPIEFNLTGDYWRTVAFLKQLSQFPKMLAVEEVSLTPTEQAQRLQAPDLRVKMTLLALIQKGEEKWTSDASDAKNSSS